MNGRRLLQCLNKGFCLLSDLPLQSSISLHENGVVSRGFSYGAADCWSRLRSAEFHNACIEKFDMYVEESEAWIQNQNAVPETCRDQEDKNISLHNIKRKRTFKSSGPLEDSKSSILQHEKHPKLKRTVCLKEPRTLDDSYFTEESSEIQESEMDASEIDTKSSHHPRKKEFMTESIDFARQENKSFSQDLLDDGFKKTTDGRGRGRQVSLVPRKESDAKLMFQELCLQKGTDLQRRDRDELAKIFRHFLEEDWPKERALRQHHISAVLFPKAVSSFRRLLFSRCTHALKKHLLQLGLSYEGDCFLLDLVVEFSNREFPDEIARYKALVETADLTKPHTWFPFARAMKRRLVYHFGPTNSGKTYNALQKFKSAKSGVYCAPLRLLAMEVYDVMNADGVYCSLVTGQDKREVPFANHISCTVEMVSTAQAWEVAILDEIQLITDEYRGWAWTRAFFGLQADELHLCGDPSVLKLVRSLCALTGDDLKEFSYERFEPLSITEQSLEGKYSKVQTGDCIVAFSRKEIFNIKRAVELFTKNRCCVIYGALPPETRTHQAKLFNDPGSGYDVLVATDAVGMGLNLSIRRLIFHSFEKHTGEELKRVSASQVKQIAGRAGRRGTLYPNGLATTFFPQDIPYLVQCLQEPVADARSAGLFPGLEQIELFASQLPGATFSKLLDHFAEICQVDGAFFLCSHDHLKRVAGVIDKVKDLTVEEKLSFALAPVNSRDAKALGALLRFAIAYSQKVPIHLSGGIPAGSADSVLQLMNLEARHHVLSLYLWLSHHFPEEYFPHRAQAEQMAADIALVLGETLAHTNIKTDKIGPSPARKKALGSGRSSHGRMKRF